MQKAYKEQKEHLEQKEHKGHKQYKAVIFDMDGTLVDTERMLLNIWESTAKEMGYVFSLDVMKKTIGITLADTIRVMLEEYPDAPHDEIRALMSERFRKIRESGQIALRPGAQEALEGVSKSGLKIGLCTSTRSSSAKITLKATGIHHYFDAVAFGDEVTRGKPDPEPYLLVASRLGADPGDCLAVEDSPSGARSALSAGMSVAYVPDIIPPPEEITDKITVLESIVQVISLICRESRQ